MISRISRNAVKEGFDTLPAAICYFDRNGLLRLINHRMQEIAAVLCGRDLQTLTDLEQALHSPGGGVRLRDEAARIYKFPDGTVYQHILDPKTGYPVESDLLSVSILCDNGTMADAYSTALYVMGSAGAQAFWRTHGGFEMILITTAGQVLYTPGLSEKITPTEGSGYEYVSIHP